MSYQLGAELLNFGAFIGFMGVNLAAFVRYFVRGSQKTFLNLAAAASRFRGLSLHLGEPANPGQTGRSSLACGGPLLRGLENQRLPL